MSAPATETATGRADSAAADRQLAPPWSLLMELSHRCPLRCPYCSNPETLVRRAAELTTADWLRVLDEAADLGIHHVHFSGGEPLVRDDLETLVERAAALGLYGNLITAGTLLDRGRLDALAGAGLDHVQISLQDTDAGSADLIAGLPGAFEAKLRAAALVREAGLPLTLNAVVHRRNIDRVAELIALAERLDAARIEIAHVQYYGWALRNIDALMPALDQVERAMAVVEEARVRLKGRLTIDAVVPDYYARRPKPCLGGWGRHGMMVTPSGRVLPCHAAESIPGLQFPHVTAKGLAEIWQSDSAFRRFRGTEWMEEPCRSCPAREVDFGGCRCQAMAIAGRAEATDPACALSPHHGWLRQRAERAASGGDRPYAYRNFAGTKGSA